MAEWYPLLMWEDLSNVLKPHYRFESCLDYKVYKTPMRIGKHPTVTSDRQCLKIRGKEKTNVCLCVEPGLNLLDFPGFLWAYILTWKTWKLKN